MWPVFYVLDWNRGMGSHWWAMPIFLTFASIFIGSIVTAVFKIAENKPITK